MPTIAKNITLKKTWSDVTRDYTHHFSDLNQEAFRVYVDDGGLVDTGGDPWTVDEGEVYTFLREYAQDARDHGVDMQWVGQPNGGVAIHIDSELSLITGKGSDDVALSALAEALRVVVAWDEDVILDYPEDQLREWTRSHGGGVLGTPGWSSRFTIHGGRAREEAHLLDRASYGVEVLRRFTRERGHESARLDWQPATD